MTLWHYKWEWGTQKQCVTVSFNNKNNEIYDIIVYIKRSASTGLWL